MNQENVPTKHDPANHTSSDVAFALSLIGGILIALGSAAGMWLGAIGGPFFGGMGGMMGYYGYPYMMSRTSYYNYGGYYYGMMYGLDAVGIIAGVLVIVFALLMRSKPASRKTYGVLILVFSVVSFAGMGGFFIGAVLGLVGGVLALVNT